MSVPYNPTLRRGWIAETNTYYTLGPDGRTYYALTLTADGIQTSDEVIPHTDVVTAQPLYTSQDTMAHFGSDRDPTQPQVLYSQMDNSELQWEAGPSQSAPSTYPDSFPPAAVPQMPGQETQPEIYTVCPPKSGEDAATYGARMCGVLDSYSVRIQEGAEMMLPGFIGPDRDWLETSLRAVLNSNRDTESGFVIVGQGHNMSTFGLIPISTPRGIFPEGYRRILRNPERVHDQEYLDDTAASDKMTDSEARRKAQWVATFNENQRASKSQKLAEKTRKQEKARGDRRVEEERRRQGEVKGKGRERKLKQKGM